MCRSEKNRRKANCITCGIFKPIKAKNMCQNCWHKEKRKYNLKFFLSTRYSEIKMRCLHYKENKPRYYGLKFCTKEEFMSKFLNNKVVIKMYRNWQKSNFNYKLVPSIDRIDTNGDYTIDNIQFLTMIDNVKKDNGVYINAYDKNRNFIGKFRSQRDAAKATGTHQANVYKVCRKLRKHTGGFYFEYA